MGNGLELGDVVVPPLRLRWAGAGLGSSRPFRLSLRGESRLRLDPRLRAAWTATPPRLDLGPAFRSPSFRVSSSLLRRLQELQQEGRGPSWESPAVEEVREASVKDLLRAILAVPEVKRARGRLEELGRAELEALWRRSFRDRPGRIALAAPVVLSVAAGGAVAVGHAFDFDVPKLPPVPMGLPGLTLQIEYVHSVEGMLQDPLRPRSFGARFQLDLTRLVEELR